MTRARFEHEFKALYLPLGMYALRLVGDVDKAEDIVQEAFVKVWEIVGQGAGIADFKAYMYRAVRNVALGHLRDAGRFVPIDEATEVVADTIDTSERDARLRRAIDELPSRCREVFLMSKRDGLSNVEIAAELGISVKTVENQMTKAFARLRSALTASGGKAFFLPFL